MSRIAKTPVPAYSGRVYRSRTRIPVVHLVLVETWKDAAGKHRVMQAKALCGVQVARCAEDSTTPVRCARCKREAAALAGGSS